MQLREMAGMINLKHQANIVYRFGLPINASASQRRRFKRHIELTQRTNPNLVIIPDWPQKHEEEAFVVLLKDKDYNKRRTAYLAMTSLSRAFSGTYGR